MASFDTIITQLKMLGVSAYVAGARSAATSTRDIGYASETASGKALLMRQGLMGATGALRTMGTVAAHAGAAVLLLSAYGAKVGLEFDSGMERAEIGMTTLLKSSKKAQALVADVTAFATKAPLFGIEEMQQAAQQLVGVGMDAKEVVPTLQTFSDTLSALGRRPEDLLRMRYAFTQMMSKGTVSAEELRGQLGEIFPAMKILAREMGITTGELRKRMKEGAVGSKQAIELLLRGMDEDFGGATKKMNKTFYGQLQNMKENAKVVLGAIFRPLFVTLRDDVFPWIRKISKGIGDWANARGPEKFLANIKAGMGKGLETPGGKIQDIALGIGKAFKWIKDQAVALWDAMKPAKPFLDNVLIPLAAGFAVGLLKGIEGLIPVLKVLFQILGFIGKLAAPLKGVFAGIGFVLGFIIGPAKILGPIFKLIGGAFRLVAGAGKAVFGVLIKFSPLFNKIVGALLSLFFKWKGLWTKMFEFVGKAVGKIVGLAVGLATKLGAAIGSAVKGALDKMGKIIVGFKDIGKKAIDGLISVLKAGGSMAAGIAAAIANAVIDLLNDAIPNKIGPIGLPDNPIPNFAAGTGYAPGGVALVGERGPELVRLPRGAAVIPNHALSGLSQSQLSGAFSITVNSYLDGKLVYRNVAEHTADEMARR